MLKNRIDYEELFDKTSQIKTFDEYISTIKKPKVWVSTLEIIAASRFKQFNFQIFVNNSSLVQTHINNPNYRMLYLEFIHGNHYNMLIPKTSNSIFINLKRTENISSTEFEQKMEEHEEQNKNSHNEIRVEEDLSHETAKEIKTSNHETYPMAKQKRNAFNEAYQYLKYKFVQKE